MMKFALALIASGRLDNYQRDNKEIPLDPFLEYGLESVKKNCGNDIELKSCFMLTDISRMNQEKML